MAKWWKVVSMILLAGSMAFAQFDDNESSDASDESSYSADEESDDSVGSATASGDQWEGFKYEEMGLTQWEFQQAKEEGISREKLTHLIELGVRLSEYLQRPWEKLGVSEDQWLDERSAGMEDADIDRSYRNRSGDQTYAYVSLFLPSFYQWKTDKTMKAIWMDALWVAGVGATVYMAADGSSNWFYFLIPVIGAHIWSFADAFFDTQWDSNPDANRFSFGILPTPDKGVAGALLMKF